MKPKTNKSLEFNIGDLVKQTDVRPKGVTSDWDPAFIGYIGEVKIVDQHCVGVYYPDFKNKKGHGLDGTVIGSDRGGWYYWGGTGIELVQSKELEILSDPDYKDLFE